MLFRSVKLLKGKRLKPVVPAGNQPFGHDSVEREELNAFMPAYSCTLGVLACVVS